MIGEVAISSDIIGIWGNIDDLNKVYGTLTKKIELIGWLPTLPSHLKQAQNCGFEVVSIHGRLTSLFSPEPLIKKIPLVAANLMLYSTGSLITHADRHDILLHAPHLHNEHIINQLRTHRKNIKFIWVENDNTGLQGMNEAVYMVNKLRSLDIRCGLVFDLSHFIGPENLTNENFPSSWNELINYTDRQLFAYNDPYGRLIPISFHFPIGTKADDALPVLERMDGNMLASFSRIIVSKKIERFIIENQQQGMHHQFRLYTHEIQNLKNRTVKILEKLQIYGILPGLTVTGYQFHPKK